MKEKTQPADRGQVAVEYILLFSLGLILALAISSQMVSRNPNSPGFLIAKWQALKVWIGNDDPSKRK